MGFYSSKIDPRIIDLACGTKCEPAKIVPSGRGRALEVGFRSGYSLAYYNQATFTHLFALEQSETMRRHARKRFSHLPFQAEWLNLPEEQIPLENESVDTMLATCSL